MANGLRQLAAPARNPVSSPVCYIRAGGIHGRNRHLATAILLMGLHGENAKGNAAQRGVAALENGDRPGFAVWMAVATAIDHSNARSLVPARR